MLLNEIKEIITRHLDISQDEISMESSITRDLGADSLAILDILMDIEEAYDVDIPEKQIGTAVCDIIAFIENSRQSLKESA